MRSLDELNQEERESLIDQIVAKKNNQSDLDWSDIVSMYDLDMNSDTLRKAGVGVKFVHDTQASVNESFNDNAYVERQKLFDLRRDIRKGLREYSRSEMICHTIHDAIKHMPPLTKAEYVKHEHKDGKRSMVICIGDFHYGAEFVVEGLYGEEINQYNSEKFELRMHDLMSRCVEIGKSHDIGDIHLMIAGDMLDGLLRSSQISRLEYGVIESAMRLGEFLSEWIDALYRLTKHEIHIHSVRGNHGEIRPLGTKAGQFPEENMERIVMHYVYARLEGNKCIHLDNDCPKWKMVDVCGYNFMLIHGEGNDVEKMARDCVNLYHKPIDMFVVGHLHKSQTFMSGIANGGNSTIERVPSMCGIDPYAQSLGCGSRPGATVMIMKEGYGRECVYPIVFTE